MASFADDIADIARPRSMEYVAGMAEGNEFGANAKRLARLIEAVSVRVTLLAINPPSEYLNNRVATELAAAVAEARR